MEGEAGQEPGSDDQSVQAAAAASADSISSNKQIPPICQRCGIPMVRRVARKGKNAGSEFWGCPNFPNCRNIVPIKKG